MKTSEGAFRQNWHQMVSLPDQERPEPGSNSDEESELEDTDALEATAYVSPQPRVYQTRSRSGLMPTPPERLNPSWS